MFGFSGAHRSGKSTLAKEAAEISGIPFVDSSVSETMRKAGYDMVGITHLEQRIEAQEKLLQFYLEKIESAPKPFITDRTPLDMVAYTMGELTMLNCPPELGARFNEYSIACLQAAAKNFNHIFVTRPHGGYALDPAKPPLNVGYQWMVQLLTEGAVNLLQSAPSVSCLMTSDHQTRVEAVMSRIVKELTKLEEYKKEHRFN